MDPVNPLNRIIETLRHQLAESAKRMDKSRSGTSADKAQHHAHTNRPSTLELRRQIEKRVRSIEPDAPNRQLLARRMFLESVLAWEFGDQLLVDGEFHRVVENISETIESDSEISNQLNTLLAELAKR